MSKKKKRQSKPIHFKGIVRHPLSSKILGWFLLICFVAIFLGAMQGEEKELMIFAAICFLISILLILFYNLEVASFDDNGFTYRNFLGMSYRYDWSQIKKVQEKKKYNRYGERLLRDTIITTEKHKIRLQGNMDNIEEFKICIFFKCRNVFDETILP